MKKIVITLVFLLIPLKVSAISARNMIAMDMDTNRVLYEKSSQDAHLIASITKIMTCILAIESESLDKVIEVDDTVLKAYGSAIYIEMGEKLTLRDLLYGLMLRSGNDAALVIAKSVGGDVENFVSMMNQKAIQIGMKQTTFTNPHGLDDNGTKGNTSTAYDMALLTSYAMQNEEYKQIVSTKNYTCKSDKKSYSWANKNKLLSSYKYTTGGKTGYTINAKRTLVSTASKDNMNIVIVSLNDPNDWDDHQNLYEEIFRNYQSTLVVSKDNFQVEEESYYKEDTLFIKNDVYVTLKEEEKENIELHINLDKLPKYKNNDLVGVVEVTLHNKVLKTENIYVKKESKEKPKLSFWKKLIGWFT